MVEEAKLAEYEKKLADNLFLDGHNPGKLDAEVLELCTKNKFVPDQEKNPNFWAWYSTAILFEDAVVKTWGEEHGKGGKHKGGKQKEEKKEEKADDDFDPFAEETEDDKKALEEMKKKNKEGKDGKKKKKEKGPEKSCVLIDIKGFESDQDLNSLAKKIMKEIKMEGLLWNKEYKLEEVAFGIKKIVMGLVVEDERCSVDEVIEKIQEYEDEVQSVEITSFNKI